MICFFFSGVFGNIEDSSVFRNDESSLLAVLQSRGQEGASNYAVINMC